MHARKVPDSVAVRCRCHVAPPAFAQAWPTQPIKIIVGFPPGGVADAIPRYLQEKLKDSLGQPIVVENKPGGAGIIAMDAIAKATDGHTVGVMTLQNLIVPATGARSTTTRARISSASWCSARRRACSPSNSEMPIKSVQRADRVRKGESRQARVRDQRQRDRPALRDREPAPRRQHRHRARAVQGRRAGVRRCAREPRARDVHDVRLRQAALGVRQGASARRLDAEALQLHARTADDGGSLGHQGFQPDRVVRAGGAGEHAEAGDGEALQGARPTS